MKKFSTYIILNTILHRITALFPLFIMVSGCIDDYKTVTGDGSGFFVVDASLVKNRDVQYVILSRSIGNQKDTIPYIAKCNVYVEDELGNIRNFNEVSQGHYEAAIEDDYLVTGHQYRVTIETESGEVYQSDYDKLYNCPPVDSLYYQHGYRFDNFESTQTHGFQFYVDLPVKEEYSSYYCWFLEEDWEIRIPYLYYGEWTGSSLIKDPVDLSRCYKHIKSRHISVTSTANLENNSIKTKNPIFFVQSDADKLRYRYSLLVKQISLSPGGYNYWQQKVSELEESASLYITQPCQNNTNIKNLNNEDEQIFGYFWTGIKTEKRFFINSPVHSHDQEYICEPIPTTIEEEEIGISVIGFYTDSLGNYYDSIPPGRTDIYLTYDTMPLFHTYLYECNEFGGACKLFKHGYVGDYMIVGEPGAYRPGGDTPNLYGESRSCFDCRTADSDTAVPEFWKGKY